MECAIRTRGRPAKKPGYDRGAEIQNLIDAGVHLWKCIIAFEGYPFRTSGRGQDRTGSTKFKYEIPRSGGKGGHRYTGEGVDGYGNGIWITVDGAKRDKSISRSTVDLAYKKGRHLMKMEGQVKGPKALGIPGAGGYLYPIFIRFGIISAERGGDKAHLFDFSILKTVKME